ncbi:MAG: TIGR02444 family protein, partial [Caulobacteraceae bacterium]|nr:TIGR02444 family protein [Caulobacteraceae bacterium]
MTLWDWAVQAYARSGVARACLTLQDAHGQNVPYLLWALRRAALGPPLDAADLARAATLARSWEAAGLCALRAARRGLKPPAPGIDDAGR